MISAADAAPAGVAREVTRLGVTSVMVIASKTERRLAERVSPGIPVAPRQADDLAEFAITASAAYLIEAPWSPLVRRDSSGPAIPSVMSAADPA